MQASSRQAESWTPHLMRPSVLETLREVVKATTAKLAASKAKPRVA